MAPNNTRTNSNPARPVTMARDSARSSWWRRPRTLCSKESIAALAALLALLVGAYYFYDQHTFSSRTWRLGIWKDCHSTDFPEISGANICQKYTNLSYDSLTSRSINDISRNALSTPLTEEPLPQYHKQTTTAEALKIGFVAVTRLMCLTVSLPGLAALAVSTPVYVRDMITGRYFPRVTLFIGSFWIATVAFALQASGSHAKEIVLFFATFVIFAYRYILNSKNILANLANTTGDDDKLAVKKRGNCSLSGLLCSPINHAIALIVYFCGAVAFLSLTGPRTLDDIIGNIYKSGITWLLIFRTTTYFTSPNYDGIYVALHYMPTIDPESLTLRRERPSHNVVLLDWLTTAAEKTSQFLEHLQLGKMKRQ